MRKLTWILVTLIFLLTGSTGVMAKEKHHRKKTKAQIAAEEAERAAAEAAAEAEAAKNRYAFSDEQLQLNAMAAEATQANDYKKAELLFKANLELGEFDITWLNLGRTYARQKKCVEARNAYNRVLEAPPISETMNFDINPKLNQFVEELNQECVKEFDEYDNWEKYSWTYQVAGVGLMGGGLFFTIIGAAIPSPKHKPSSFEGYLNEVEFPSEVARFKEDYNNYYYKHAVPQGLFLSIGIAATLAGVGMMVADYLKFGEQRKAKAARDAEAQNALEAEQSAGEADDVEETGTLDGTTESVAPEESTSFLWAPSFVVNPDYVGIGIGGRF